MNLKTGLWILIFSVLWLAGLLMMQYMDKHPGKTKDQAEWDRLEALDTTDNTITCTQLGKEINGFGFYEVFSHTRRYLLIMSPNKSIAIVENK